MATDAEITLKFTAEIQEALKAIHQLRDEMEKIRAAGGMLSPEDAAMMEEMRGKLGDYTRQVRELQIEYYRLQQRSGEMSAEFIGRLTELRKELAETKAQLSPLLQKIVDLQVEVNHLKENSHQAGDELIRAGESGQSSFRSLRGILGNFIRDLMRGKIAVREFGIALKGLSKATLIFAAISFALDFIYKLLDKIKSTFEKDSKAAQAAADALKGAQDAAEQAHDAIAATGEAMQDAARDRSLERQAAAVAAHFQEQRDAAQETVDAINEQARAEARKRALAAQAADYEREMQKMELKIALIDEKITPAQYKKRLAEMEEEQAQIEARRANEAARAEETTAQRKWNRAFEAQQAAGAEYTKRKKALDGMKQPDTLDALEKQLEATRQERDTLREQLDNATEQELPEETIAELYQKWDDAANRAAELYDELQKAGNTKQEYELAKKNADEALKNLQAAEQAFKQADAEYQAAHNDTMATQEQGQATIAQARGRREKATAMIDAEERRDRRNEQRQAADKAKRERERNNARRDELQERIDTLARQGEEAAATPGLKDDRKFYDKLSSFLDNNGQKITKLGANTDILIGIVEKLNIADNNQQTMIDKLESRLEKLAREVKINQKKLDRQSRL